MSRRLSVQEFRKTASKKVRPHSCRYCANICKLCMYCNLDNIQNVAQLGDGDTSMHRLAESKYTNKSSSS